MSQPLNPDQLNQLCQQLQARRDDLQQQMEQNRANLSPVEVTAGSVSQDDNARLSMQTREVNAGLTAFDLEELARIDRAFERMDEGSYGLCNECGCDIPFERLMAEPMTQHCVPCKSRWEQSQGIGRS